MKMLTHIFWKIPHLENYIFRVIIAYMLSALEISTEIYSRFQFLSEKKNFIVISLYLKRPIKDSNWSL
jgi:hypothetical protein